jgi:hypothetical protein
MRQIWTEARTEAINTNKQQQIFEALRDTNPYVIIATVAAMFDNVDYTEMWNWTEDQAGVAHEDLARLFVRVGKAEGAF